jgi:ApaG protein
MVTAITDGIKVSVESVFQSEYSNPASEHFMFAYRIEIINQSDFPVKLLRRKWIIFDSNNTKREVEGEGVVGLQPIIQPGETHVYVSGSNLKTEMGSMRGNYLMQRLNDSTLFYVDIPVFELVADYKLN